MEDRKEDEDFEDLIRRISPRLRAISHKLNGRYTVVNEDDLYQEALLYLWQKWRDDSLMDKTASYILQGCYFCLKNYIRKTCKETDLRSLSLQESVTKDGAEIEDWLKSPQPEDDLDILEENFLEEKIKNMLNERERKVFRFLLEGFTIREIGKKLNVSHVMVAKIKNRIKQKCKFLKPIFGGETS